MILLLLACTQSTGFQKPDSDATDTAEDTGYVGETDTDTADTDGDLDGDGYTPEEGDCDDSSVYVSPARDEDEYDGLDNDCDARVDEAFYGVDVAYVNADGASSILTIDSIGRPQDEITLDDGCAPSWIDYQDLFDPHAGWYGNNGFTSVVSISAEGTCAELANFEEAEACTDLTGVYGIATGPDGTLYATTLDRLWSIGTDGTLTELASWDCSLMDVASHSLAAYSLAVDPVSGQVALFGYFGGFATWDATNGFSLSLAEDWENATLSTFSGAHRDEGGWFTPAVDAKGAYGIYRFEDGDWSLQASWESSSWQPFMLAIDGDEGDWYVTANAGWYYTVWRIVADTGYQADLYSTDGDVPNRAFQGIVSRYTYGGK